MRRTKPGLQPCYAHESQAGFSSPALGLPVAEWTVAGFHHPVAFWGTAFAQAGGAAALPSIPTQPYRGWWEQHWAHRSVLWKRF